MATPLTDAIEALTTYANTVTGASDQTLSEAVATLASGYGGAESLYSLGMNYSGSFTYITIEKNHVRIDFKTARESAFYINFRYQQEGTTQSSLNNQSTWFTIPANSDIVMNISNYQTDIPSTTFSYNMRLANSNSSLANFTTGQISADGSATTTVTEDTNIGNIFAYSGNIPASGYIEFDMTVTVNGIRYI